MTADEVAGRLVKARRTGAGWSACCPAHEDRTPSLSINDGESGVVVRCHAGCTQDAVLMALESQGIDIRRPKTNGHADVSLLLSLESLSAAKGITLETLRENGVEDAPQGGVAFQYYAAGGERAGVKYRKYLGGGSDRGFTWERGSKPCLYGLWRLERDFANDGRVILCEGETDALTLWQHGYTALALPGANMWKDEYAQLFPEGAKIYVILEPDQGGRVVEADIAESPLRTRAHFIRMNEAVKDPSALHLADASAFVDAFDRLVASAEPVEKKKEPRIVLRSAATIMAERKETDWLIDDTLEKRVIALMVGARGSLKSFVALDWLMRLAVEGRGVVALSAEGDGLGRRIEAWHQMFAPKVEPDDLRLVAMERSISLCLADVRAELCQAIDALKWAPEVLLIDTLSKYSSGLDENENSEVRDFLEALSTSFRNVYGCTVLLVAHTGYAASERIRGASSFGANTEAEYIVTRASPMDLVCKVSRERFKDSPALEPIGYQGEVVDLGRQDKRGRSVTSLVLRAGAQLPDAKPQVVGANQRKAITALTEWLRTHPTAAHITTMDIGDILKVQGIGRQRKPEVLNALVNARIITPSIGGYSIDRTAL